MVDWSGDDAIAGSLDRARQLLTERAQEVLALLADNLTYAQIGEELMISLSTVRTHVDRVYKKLDVHRSLGIPPGVVFFHGSLPGPSIS
jgi:DNA-binding CsgD family transcriptional regulator